MSDNPNVYVGGLQVLNAVSAANGTMLGPLDFIFEGITYRLTNDRYGGNYLNITNTTGVANVVIFDSTTNSGSTNAESTLTLRVNDSAGAEFVDYFSDHYSSNGDVINGVLNQKTGTGSYRDYMFAFYDAADTDPANQIKRAQRFYRISPRVAAGSTTTRTLGQIYFRPPDSSTNPSAHIHIGTGVGGATVGSAPLKIDSGTNLTTAEAGAIEYDGSSLYHTDGSATRGSLQRAIFSQTATKSIANTTAETSLIGTGVGSTTLPANFFVAGRIVRLTLKGQLSTTGTPTLTLKAKLGSNVLIASSAVTLPSSITSRAYNLEVDYVCRVAGASGTFVGEGLLTLDNSTAAYTIGLAGVSTVTVDTTASQALDLTATWGTGDPANVAASKSGQLEVIY